MDANVTAGTASSNITQINGTSIAGTGTRVADAFVAMLNVASPVFTVASVNQTGDSFLRLTGTGAVTFASLTVSGTTTRTGAVGLGSTLAIAGTTTFNALTVANALIVSGATTLTGAVTASNASNAITGIDVVKLGGVSQSLLDLKDFADDGYDPATNKVQGVVLVDTVSAVSFPTGESNVLPNGTGTAAAGTATTITLQTALGADTRVVGCGIKLNGGTGAGQYRNATVYVNSSKIMTVDRPWTTNPSTDTTYAVVYDNCAVETVCRYGAAFTSSAGTEVRISAWLERNGQIITTYAASASCTVAFRENGSGSDLFTVTDSAVNAQGIFELTQATPGFTSDRLQIASVAITEGGNVFTSREPAPIFG